MKLEYNNLISMFEFTLEEILTCLTKYEMGKAVHHCKEALKTFKRLKKMELINERNKIT